MSNSLFENIRVLYSNWFKPIRGDTHADRLNSFYETQAGAYDNFRENFLHGRKPMLAAAAARLEEERDIIWVDMGGGTGYNVELMENIMGSLNSFKKIIVVDLCHPLCEVAKQRVQKKGWTNVEVVEGDVCKFSLPEGVKATFVTFSYSLSMIPPFYDAIDNAVSIMAENALFGVADFYVSDKFDAPSRQNSTISRLFWKSVFDLDGIYLDPARRQYLDHKISKEYEFNDAGHIPFVPVIQAPFYIWLGRVHHDNRLHPAVSTVRPGKGFPSTFIYSMTWEDPTEDAKVFPIDSADSVLSLTSGGCNLLDMLLDGPRKVTGVDLNPAQNHLVELKKVAIKRLEYEDFWKMFGDGKHENIRALYDERLAPFLSQDAHVFWSKRLHYFDHCFYYYGAMGWLVYAIQKLGPIMGFDQDVKNLLECGDLDQQWTIWNTRLRWKIMGFSRLMDNPIALWMFNGVPKNQMDMLRAEGSLVDYNARVFDQVVKNSNLKKDNYFYRVVMSGRYTQECCPRYLKREHFLRLKNERLVDRLELRTDSFKNVLKDGQYSKIVLMDHLDWLTKDYVRDFAKDLAAHVVKGGKLIWRSASRQPWYAEFIKDAGFSVRRVSFDSQYMDRVNMYASFYLAEQTNGVETDVGYSST